MSKLKLHHNQKTYILEYTRSIASLIERQGFNIEEVTSKPNVNIPLLVVGAFKFHHPKVKETTIWEVWNAQNKRTELIGALMEMYTDTVQSLLGDDEEEVDEKNATWELV